MPAVNKSLKVKYYRTDTGCLQVFVSKDDKLVASLTLFPTNNLWLDVNNEYTEVYVYPDNALHRVWYKEVCRACGWESKPAEGVPMGPGGMLDCPECRKANRNGPWVEGVYGDVHSVKLDWKTKEPIKEAGEKNDM